MLNDVEGARVAASTRKRVEAAAVELGYAPNHLARGLRTQRTHTIGMLSDQVVTTPYAGRMILGAQQAAWEAGYLLLLVSTDGDVRMEAEAIRELKARQVDGLLYATMYHQLLELPAGLSTSSTVVLDADVVDGSVPHVVPDDERGGYEATRELLRHGHTRIAYLANAHDVPANQLRLAGYRRALAEAGITFDPTLVIAEAALSAGGERAAAALLSRRHRPTAIFVFNDRMAVGVFRAARRAGLSVPDDISIVGYDDQELVASDTDPGLTTMALPHLAMGQWAANRLIAMINSSDPSIDGHTEPRKHLEPCPLVVRGSVGPPPRNEP
ncbi:LacI family DNA-binding transcriptional regulator [Actinotalea sp. K2]|nr:LacI family DNA-binding transcriptional regulator [Actinotalea sp. K2]